MKAYSTLRFAMVVLVVVGLVAMSLDSPPARAAGPWYVTPGGDDGNDCLSPATPCATINGAIAKASPGDTVYVAVGTYTGTGLEVVLLDRDLILSGGWDAAFSSQGGTSTIDGETAHRGITVNSGVTTTIERFTIVRGGGSGIAFGNGIWNAGSLTLNASEVSLSLGGLGTLFQSTLILNHSAVRDNTATGIVINWASVTLNNSTISGNAADNAAGIFGYGTYDEHSTLALNNSTVSGNRSEGVGGIAAEWTDISLNNSTITGNAGFSVGGIHSYLGAATMQNTVIAGNTASGGYAPDCGGAFSSAGYNLIGNAANCSFTPGPGDLTGVDAHLGQLIGVPGAPRYHPLLLGSPAIDAGNPAGCTDHQGNLLATDQRGAARVGRCDMGAYEYTVPGPAASIYAHAGTPQHAPPFGVFGEPFQAAVLDGIGTPVYSATVTFLAPTSGPSGTFSDTGAVTTTAATGENGVAGAATFTANELVGSYVVTATVSGIVGPAHFLLDNLVWYVAPGGDDANDCLNPGTPCATINGVLHKPGFLPSDTILASAGTYTGIGDEVVWLDKSATLSGGWDASFTTQGGMSTIDGEDTREGIHVGAGVSAVIERFTVENAHTGVYNNDATLVFDHSTIHSNEGSGILNFAGTLILNNSTVSDNHTAYGGGGLSSYSNGTVVLNNSSVSGNEADSGGGIWLNLSAALLNNSTVSANSAATGGGISMDPDQPGTVVLNNSIVAGNTAASSPDCFGSIGSAGYNLVGDTSGCTFTPAAGDLTGVDARLGPLVGVPGTPNYHPLLSSSPAVDAGNPGGCADSLGNPLDTDQRGAARVGRCDMGAYEYTTPGPPALVYARAGTPQRAAPTRPFPELLQAAVLDAVGSPIQDVSVTFTAPVTGASGIFADAGTPTTTLATAETGIATAPPFTANAVLGQYTVMATVVCLAQPAGFSLRNSNLFVAEGGDDGNDCESPATPCAGINAAIAKANPGETIYVAAGTYYLVGQGATVVLDRDVALSGGWDAGFSTRTGASVIDAQDASGGGLDVHNNVAAVVEWFVIQHGGISNNGDLTVNNCVAKDGVGINNPGRLTATNSTILDNTVQYTGGGIYNSGTLTLTNCVLSGNTAMYGMGGALYNSGLAVLDHVTVNGNSAGFGAGLQNSGSLTVNSSVIRDNSGSGVGGGIWNSGDVILNNSTIQGHTVYDGGGGIFSNAGTVILNNSTISGNRATNDPNGRGGGIYSDSGIVRLNNSTVSGNMASWGGGIYSGGGVTLQNSIVTGNTGSNGQDCSGTLSSAGYNLVGDASGCDFVPGTGDLLDVDARLFALVGQPGYHPLRPYSPAIDAGNPAGCTDHLGNPLLTDERGTPRPLDGDGDGNPVCDMGAYEVDPEHPITQVFLPLITREY